VDLAGHQRGDDPIVTFEAGGWVAADVRRWLRPGERKWSGHVARLGQAAGVVSNEASAVRRKTNVVGAVRMMSTCIPDCMLAEAGGDSDRRRRQGIDGVSIWGASTLAGARYAWEAVVVATVRRDADV
jgi:hypothetical protein